MMQTPNPYAPPRAPLAQAPHPTSHVGAGACSRPFFDDNDAGIVNEAAQARLALDDKRELTAESQSTAKSVWQAFSGSHTPVKIRVYDVRSQDGFVWSYRQPYSMTYQMPGDHVFRLRGALPQMVEVLPAHNNWRRPRFLLAVGILSFFLLFLFGAGILVFLFFAWVFPMRARFRSTDKALEKWIKSRAELVKVVRATKWGWLGLFGSSGWKLPWVVRLTPRADGTSELVVRAPDIGRLSLTRYRVGFGPALVIARQFQAILEPQTAPLQTS